MARLSRAAALLALVVLGVAQLDAATSVAAEYPWQVSRGR